MGDINQFHYVKNNAAKVTGKVLEIGSKDYGRTPDFRPIFREQGYLGVDLEPGKGVDMVLDLCQDLDAIDRQLGGERFGAVICNSVLEHCSDPFKMAKNISALLKPNGALFLSVPHSWRIHGYPMDYWRFTPEGLKLLFPDFDFVDSNLATANENEVAPVDNSMYRVELDWRKGLERKAYTPITAAIIVLCRRLSRLFPNVYLLNMFRQPYLLRPVNIFCVAKKR